MKHLPLDHLEEALGHRFANRALLEQALTHSSFARESTEPAADNEQMEFLGDAVLQLVASQELYQRFPAYQEGELSKLRAHLVNAHHLVHCAVQLHLGSYLRLGRGEEKTGGRRKTALLSDAVEALLAALFLDGGLEPVRVFARRYVMGETEEQLARELRSGAALGNYKSALQEYMQSERLGTPLYRVKSESGPDHRKRFLVEVRLKTEDDAPIPPLARGRGSTKKLAEQDAARRALQQMKAGETRVGATAPGVKEEDQPEE
jgi:ribonuclease-3